MSQQSDKSSEAPRESGTPERGLARVAIVGRPNVGKSTLVNRILGRRAAITQETPGATRDRVSYQAEWAGRSFELVDTCSRPESAAIAARLRRGSVPVLLVANKVDSGGQKPQIGVFWSLGLGEPLPVSSLHGRGSGDLLDALVERLGPERRAAPGDRYPAVAIVGRPNVGKSSLLNRMAGAELAIVHPAPGTTRDTVDSVVEHDGGRYRVVDTAGMRRSFQQAEGADYFALVRSFQAVDRADVALLVLDAQEGV